MEQWGNITVEGWGMSVLKEKFRQIKDKLKECIDATPKIWEKKSRDPKKI